jgi:small subunit ribosomal protein S6
MWYNLKVYVPAPALVGAIDHREEVCDVHTYELLFIVKPDLEDEATTAAVDKYLNLIQQNQGTVEQVSRWGKKRLAYEIRDFRDGYYTLVQFQGVAATVKELDRLMRLADEVLRHMIVRKDAA